MPNQTHPSGIVRVYFEHVIHVNVQSFFVMRYYATTILQKNIEDFKGQNPNG